MIFKNFGITVLKLHVKCQQVKLTVLAKEDFSSFVIFLEKVVRKKPLSKLSKTLINLMK